MHSKDSRKIKNSNWLSRVIIGGPSCLSTSVVMHMHPTARVSFVISRSELRSLMIHSSVATSSYSSMNHVATRLEIDSAGAVIIMAPLYFGCSYGVATHSDVCIEMGSDGIGRCSTMHIVSINWQHQHVGVVCDAMCRCSLFIGWYKY